MLTTAAYIEALLADRKQADTVLEGIDKLIDQPWPNRAEIACHVAAQFQDENARSRKYL
jgi:hypothetical protein